MYDLPEVLNWRRWNEDISLSGQPTEEQLARIKEMGVTHVVNLGPHSNKGALKDEAGAVTSLGMVYHYIPVDFANPTTDDFVKFCSIVAQLAGEKLHVHCIYNARVSAFFYRYAKEGMGGSEDDAFTLMEGIWRPGGVWAHFIGNSDNTGQPNRYAGEDY